MSWCPYTPHMPTGIAHSFYTCSEIQNLCTQNFAIHWKTCFSLTLIAICERGGFCWTLVRSQLEVLDLLPPFLLKWQ